MRLKVLALAALLALPVLSFAASNPSSFDKRFVITRQDGKIVEIKDRFLSGGFKISPLLKYYKGLLSSEQARMAFSPHDYRQNLAATYGGEAPEDLVESLESLQGVDFEKVFTHPQFQKLMGQYEARINQELDKIGLVTLAAPNSPKWFYKRQAMYEITMSFLKLAKSQLGEVPVLNTAMFILKEAERMIRERRSFHQNMLMHYLQNFKPAELGMSEQEVALTLSSMYESRITWYAFWEANAAAQDWTGYGSKKFGAAMAQASARMAQHQMDFDSVGARLNFAFQEGVQKGKKVIINLFDKKNMLSSKQSIAFYYDQPKLVARQRTLLQLGQLGLSFVSLPQFAKDMANNYFKSMYDNQRLTEGALVGYFESRGNNAMAGQFIRQNVNPFEP